MLYNIDSKEEMFKKRFRPGTRIELVSSASSKSHNLSKGARGTIQNYDQEGNLAVVWDNGSNMSLIPGVDQFKQLNIDAKIQEANAIRMANIQSSLKQKSKDKQTTASIDKEV